MKFSEVICQQYSNIEHLFAVIRNREKQKLFLIKKGDESIFILNFSYLLSAVQQSCRLHSPDPFMGILVINACFYAAVMKIYER